MAAVDILALGEAMVEFNQTGAADGRLYLQGFGGDTSNFAVAAARQGARAGYVSALGDDVYGAMLRAMWREEGVDDSGVRSDGDAFTAVYFVTHDAAGHHFSFFRRGSAASRLGAAQLPHAQIAAARVLHLSGISMAISETAREACFAAIASARKAGVKVSFDTNHRAEALAARARADDDRHGDRRIRHLPAELRRPRGPDRARFARGDGRALPGPRRAHRRPQAWRERRLAGRGRAAHPHRAASLHAGRRDRRRRCVRRRVRRPPRRRRRPGERRPLCRGDRGARDRRLRRGRADPARGARARSARRR